MIRDEDADGGSFFFPGKYLECNFFFVVCVQQLYTLVNDSEAGSRAFQFVIGWRKWGVSVSVVVDVDIDSLAVFFYSEFNVACSI